MGTISWQAVEARTVANVDLQEGDLGRNKIDRIRFLQAHSNIEREGVDLNS
jgi:hypothetical protein